MFLGQLYDYNVHCRICLKVQSTWLLCPYDILNLLNLNNRYTAQLSIWQMPSANYTAIFKSIGLIVAIDREILINITLSFSFRRWINQLTTNRLIVLFQVGRALGPSILDLTGSNPMSRIQNSEFRSINGMRRALFIEMERGPKSSSVFSSAANKVIY